MKDILLTAFGTILFLLLLSWIAPVEIKTSPPDPKKINVECHSLQLKDSLQKYTSKGYALKQNFIIKAEFKDLYDGTHFPSGKGSATFQYLLIFEKP